MPWLTLHRFSTASFASRTTGAELVTSGPEGAVTR